MASGVFSGNRNANLYKKMGYASGQDAVQGLLNIYTGPQTNSGRVQGLVNQANAANKARENEIRALYDQMMGNVDQFGQTERDLIDRNLQVRQSEAAQAMMARGLYNSTLTGSRMDGLTREADYQKTALAERLAGMRNDLLGSKAGFVERIEDVSPNLGLYASAAQGAAGAVNGGRIFGGSDNRAKANSSTNWVASFLQPKKVSYTTRATQTRQAPGSNPYAYNYYGQGGRPSLSSQARAEMERRRAAGLPSYQSGTAGYPSIYVSSQTARV